MLLTGVVVAAVGSVFVTCLRTYTRQVELAQVRANLRSAMATLTRELRVLDAGDSLGSDLIALEQSALTYRAARGTYFLCAIPDLGASTVAVWEEPRAALRQVDAGRDSVLLFAENDDSTGEDDVWFPAGLNGVNSGKVCPGGESGLRLGISGLTTDQLQGVYRGAPVKVFQMTRILLYSGSDGRFWAGLRELRPGTGWTITQPIFGPLAEDGLRFEYFDAGGSVTNDPSKVARITVRIVGVGYSAARSAPDRTLPVSDSLVIHVGLRNNPR